MKRRSYTGPHGVLVVDKPAGVSSGAVVDWARWALRGAPVGHFGTLDPAATGVLLLGVGAATRLNPFLAEQDKSYRAAIVLGQSTTTADAEGEVLVREPVTSETWAQAPVAVMSLQGDWQLPPPAYSAVKVEGKRAYARARQGEQVHLEARPMRVLEIADVEIVPEDGRVDATFRVSKGTYIRSLAEELGRRLGCPAHLGRLRRLRSGAIDLSSALAGFSIDHLSASPDGKPRVRMRWTGASEDRDEQRQAIERELQPMATVLPFVVLQCHDNPDGHALIRALSHGQRVMRSHPGWVKPFLGDRSQAGVVGADGRGLVIVEGREGETWQPIRTIVGLSEAASGEHECTDRGG